MPTSLVVKYGSKILRADLGRHARSGVGHRQHHVRARLGLGHRRPPSRHRASASAASTVTRPPCGIASRALTTRFITTCSTCPGSTRTNPCVGLAGHGHDDVFADHAPQHRLDLAERDVEVDDLGLQHLAAAERQHLLGEVGGAHRGAGDLLGVGAALVLRIERVQHDLGVADDRREQVVEVVRDAAREAADRFHLLRVAQLLFEQQPLGHRIVALGHDRGEQQAAQRAKREVDEQQELGQLDREGRKRADPHSRDRDRERRDQRHHASRSRAGRSAGRPSRGSGRR